MKKLLLSTILITILSILIIQGNNLNNHIPGQNSQSPNKSIASFVDDQIFNQPPVAICQDITVSANDSCVAFVLPEQIDYGSYDPDGDSLIFSLSPEGPFPLGNNEVTLTVSDTTGEYDQCIAYILVVDDSVPTVLTQSITVYLDSSGFVSISPEEIDNGSFDNCGIDTMYLDNDSFACDDIGDNIVTLTITDYAGNISIASDTVTINDTIVPQIIVSTDTIMLWPPNHQYEDFDLNDFVISVWDNCSNLTIDDVDITYASSDEPENGTGDGDTYDDIVISNECHNISLRKERQGGENGRVYTIYFELVDGNNNVDTAICYVHAPHNQGSLTIDDGPVYEVAGDCSTISGVSKSESSNPVINGLVIYPNPFRFFTIVEFNLFEKQNVTLEIYNIQGNLIKILHRGLLPAGEYSFTWYGLNNNSQILDKGIYFIRLITNESVEVEQIIKM